MKRSGGKWNLLATYRTILPPASEFTGVNDVCVGGGALFLGLCPLTRPATLNDCSVELITTYRAVRDDAAGVMAALDRHHARFVAAAKISLEAYRGVYYALRAIRPESLPPVEMAARMIALNKTTFNGLYRQNQAGVFNAPCGGQVHIDGTIHVPSFYKAENMRRLALAFDGVTFTTVDLVKAIDAAKAGEVVFADVPYEPLKEGGFVAYDGAGFTWEDQVRTARALERAADRGCYVVAMNHDLATVRQLYKRWTIHVVNAQRSTSSVGADRGLKPELLMILDGRSTR